MTCWVWCGPVTVWSKFALIQIFGTDRLVEGRKSKVLANLKGTSIYSYRKEYLVKLLTCDRGNPIGGQFAMCNILFFIPLIISDMNTEAANWVRFALIIDHIFNKPFECNISLYPCSFFIKLPDKDMYCSLYHNVNTNNNIGIGYQI